MLYNLMINIKTNVKEFKTKYRLAKIATEYIILEQLEEKIGQLIED